MIVAVVWTGSVRMAAQTVGVSYSTAREAVAMALKVSGAGRLPALIEMITVLATGIFPKEASNGDFVLEATGLTSRQLALASCLSSGLTRTEGARAVGISPAVAKKEIDQVHSLLGTRSAAALARRLNEIKVRINLLKGNIANQKQQLEARQEEAATLERGGQPVPKDLTGTIELLRAEIGVADQQIVRFRSELAATDLRFNMDVERFHILRPNIPRP